ncbi:MAG: phosphatase PAP2 family protein [Patescibacteria group bacterium]|jgi:membrane-associated phospholipid phosphatase
MKALTKWLETAPRWRLIALGATLWGVCYFLANHWPFSQPRFLPYFLGEEKIPFVAWTLPIYWSVIPQILLGLGLIKRELLPRSYLAGAGLIIGHSLVFFFYPTTYPRPMVAINNHLIGWTYQLACWLETPGCCLPSLHVALSTLCGLVFYRQSKKSGLLWLLWTALIAISTLTTKQHYLLDIASGCATAAISYRLAFFSSHKT